MTMINWISGIPNKDNNPSEDQPKMLQNNDNVPKYVAVDHVPFDENNSGHHKVIHFRTNTGNPGTLADIGQLYTKKVGGDTQLFFKTGLGGVAQLTGNQALTNGFVWVSGILVQWGTAGASSSNSIPVTFNAANINFPNNCFNVNAIPIRAASSPGSDFSTAIVTGSVSTSGFTIGNIGGHSMAGWYWIAIGN